MAAVCHLPSAICHADQVALAWNAPACTNQIAGYNLWTGPTPGTYTNTISIGACLEATIQAPPGVIYIAATAVDVDGLQSDFSNEISYTNPGPVLTNLQLTITTTGTAILFARAVQGPWTATNRTSLVLTNPVPPLYFRSRGWSTNRVTITAVPF